MKSFLKMAFVLAAFCGLASCNSLSKDECLVADWNVIGQNDGAAGYDPQERFAQHVKSCSRVGIAPDQSIWKQGYDAGLVRYCTPMSGLAAGEAGKSYANVCPVETSEGFLRGYRLGRAAYSKRQEISSSQSQISYLQSDISRLQSELGKQTDDAGRNRIQDEIRNKDYQVRDLQRNVDRLRFEEGQISRDIQWFTSDPNRELPNRYY